MVKLTKSEQEYLVPVRLVPMAANQVERHSFEDVERPSGRALCVETTSGTVELTRLGNPVEQAELEQALNAEFHLSMQPSPDGALPKDWDETSSLEHDTVLVKSP